ncbi:E3 ubiquitin-protein ligase RNF31-like, partial [Chanos chanos]|uniref:E3 ubiquitin-protein ligase RNF31-like n=1 Tax=Chanos chanos TaxID=29144 RepID=A0A6J2VG06_CHACN
MGSPSTEFEELRQKAESHLVSTGSAQEVKAYVMMLAETALPLTTKYQHIDTKTLLLENTAGQNREEALDSLGKMVKALNVLEKYGCNLTNPTRPKYWRIVKHNNPIFRSTVDAMKRGRDVLHLYGYTTQLPDGLSYPDEVTEPDIRRVAAVAIEVMVFRAELDLLVKGSHPHSRFFESILPFLGQQKHETEGAGITSDAVIFPSTKTEETKSEPPA